jgi:hypothetical protein
MTRTIISVRVDKRSVPGSAQAARLALGQMAGYGIDGPFTLTVADDGELWHVYAERPQPPTS